MKGKRRNASEENKKRKTRCAHIQKYTPYLLIQKNAGAPLAAAAAVAAAADAAAAVAVVVSLTGRHIENHAAWRACS